MDSDVNTPEKFSYTKWDIWDEIVRNCIHNKRGVTNLSISYVIRKDTNPPTMDHSELTIYNTILMTAFLKAASRKIENILTPLVLDTYSFE